MSLITISFYFCLAKFILFSCNRFWVQERRLRSNLQQNSSPDTCRIHFCCTYFIQKSIFMNNVLATNANLKMSCKMRNILCMTIRYFKEESLTISQLHQKWDTCPHFSSTLFHEERNVEEKGLLGAFFRGKYKTRYSAEVVCFFVHTTYYLFPGSWLLSCLSTHFMIAQVIMVVHLKFYHSKNW